MKIAIDAACWNNRRGFGRFTRELIAAMVEIGDGHELTLIADSETADNAAFPPGVEVCAVRVAKPPLEAASAHSSRSISDLLRFRLALKNLTPDVVFFPAVYSYFPVPANIPALVAFHDVIAETHPQHIFPNSRARWFWNRKIKAALHRSRRIVTVSENAKQRIAQTFHRDLNGITVVGEGIDARFRPHSHQERLQVLKHLGLPADQPVLLYVGGISPHKNLSTLLYGLRLLADRGDANWKMVFVGEVEHDSFYSAHEEVQRVIQVCGLSNKVVFTGYVPDETLAALYSAARLLILPSLDEGFGLPAAEAMACGTPVAASNAGALPEVVGEAGLFFDPLDTTAMAGALSRLLKDDALHSRCSATGIERSQQHRWRNVAEKVFSELDRIVSSS